MNLKYSSVITDIPDNKIELVKKRLRESDDIISTFVNKVAGGFLDDEASKAFFRGLIK